jgi:hypothetical protein
MGSQALHIRCSLLCRLLGSKMPRTICTLEIAEGISVRLVLSLHWFCPCLKYWVCDVVYAQRSASDLQAYALVCRLVAHPVLQYFGARANLPKLLLYIMNEGRDEVRLLGVLTFSIRCTIARDC